MKKLFILSLVMIVPMTSFAKIDFNAMIVESSKQQKIIAKDVKKNLKVQDKQRARARIVVIEEGPSTYIAKTRKDMLKFDKEKRQHQFSEKKMFDRVATEFSQID